MLLDALVRQSAARTPEALAVRGPEGALTYGELDATANRLARALLALGVQPGDRVGLWTDKSTRAVAAMQAVLRVGAAYVPLDPLSPALRVRGITRDCQMRVVVTQGARAAALADEEDAPRLLCLDDGGAHGMPWAEVAALSAAPVDTPPRAETDLAYILYTSGSTGVPKGVCLSHRNALAFIQWAAEELRAGPSDRFANHAPFFFDLSVLDLYVAFLVGASVSLIPEALAFAPRQLVEFLAREEISVWYSVPSALILMMEQGRLLEVPRPPLRVVLFAGEPFPVKHLRTLRRHLPDARFLNLYGPTETNVCTFHEVEGDIPEERTEPVPIGRACCGDRVWLAPDPSAPEGPPGEVGELMVEGPTVMLGYWGHPPRGAEPYATGDIVRRLEDGNYAYLGRRDGMVKVRGRRVELGDVEAALLTLPALAEVAVAVAGSGLQSRLVAFLVPRGAEAPSLLEVKRHCAERLPRYMIVDEVRLLPALPRTRNGKVDRRHLAATLTDTDGTHHGPR